MPHLTRAIRALVVDPGYTGLVEVVMAMPTAQSRPPPPGPSHQEYPLPFASGRANASADPMEE
jgi:hypothetical protein